MLKEKTYPIGKIFSAASLLGAVLFSLCAQAGAANFDIQPIRIFLDEKVRLEKLTIRNGSDMDFPIQIKAYEWRQNAKGEDVYTETKDIITFPKILSIKKGETKLIRIGTNLPPGNVEKTYRLYVEEMPSPVKEKEGATVRLFMKIGVPIFIKPGKIDDHAVIEDVDMRNGKLQVKVRNRGNSHFIVTGVALRGLTDEGQERFARDIGGWYVLSGSQKTYETDISQDACRAIQNLQVELKTNKETVKKNMVIEKTMCGQTDQTACGEGGARACRQIGMTYGY